MNWNGIKNISIGVIIIITIPNLTFLLIDLFLFFTQKITLDPILYIISSIAGFWSVCIKVILDNQSRARGAGLILLYLLFGFVIPLLSILAFIFMFNVPRAVEVVGRAGISAMFGLSVTVGYEFIKKGIKKK